VRFGLLSGEDVAIRVPAKHADAGHAMQELKDLGGTRAEQDQVAQRPPAVHAQAARILQNRAQRHVVSVDVRDDSHPHARKPKRGSEIAGCGRRGSGVRLLSTAC
jgi:hypothetical protein